jgi:hypothetical protein
MSLSGYDRTNGGRPVELLAVIATLALLGLVAIAAGVESRDAFTVESDGGHHS